MDDTKDFAVVGMVAHVYATVICSCRKSVLVIRGLGNVVNCGHCGDEFAIGVIAYDATAEFRAKVETYPTPDIGVIRRSGLVIAPGSVLPS